jgi:hypothetical protein
MPLVEQVVPLTMEWCLECHRDPTPHLRPLEHITDMSWHPAGEPRDMGRRVAQQLDVAPRTECITCHR